MTTVYVKALPKQIAFLQDASEELLYSGAFGAGKTRALALKLVKRASVKGAYEGLCRKVRADLWQTTIATLLRPEGDLPPVLPEGTYVHDKTHSEIHIRGGGTIHYFGFDDPQRRASLNLSGCAVEEATELKEEDWIMLLGRRRRNVPGLPRQLYGACNPAAPSHWLARRFGLAPDKQTPEPGCRVIKTRSRDNHFLPEDYLDTLDRFTGLRKARYVEGEWVGSDKLVYGEVWNRSIHVEDRQFTPAARWLAIDEGFTHPFVCLEVLEDEDGRYHVSREVYRTQMQREEKVEAVRSWASGATAVADSSAAELIAALRSSLRVIPVDKGKASVFDGIVHYMQPMLVPAGDGRPRLTVAPRCRNTIMEFESYEWKDDKRNTGKEEPVKECDHAMDALRYLAVTTRTREGGVARWQGDTGQISLSSGDSIQKQYDREKAEQASAWMRGE